MPTYRIHIFKHPEQHNVRKSKASNIQKTKNENRQIDNCTFETRFLKVSKNIRFSTKIEHLGKKAEKAVAACALTLKENLRKNKNICE